MERRATFLRRSSCDLLASTDPESCVQEFHRCRNLRALRKILREADQLWTEQFLHHGGLTAIFAALSILRKKEAKTGAKDDAVSMLQCEAIECLKAAMNSVYGLEYVISSSERFVDSLVSELDTSNMLMKTQLFLLLCALCKQSEEGFQATMEALEHYKKAKNQLHRYSPLVQELQASADIPEYQAAVLAFINYIVLSSEDLGARLKLRKELSGLQLPDILATLRYSENECLGEQVKLYEEQQVADEQELNTLDGAEGSYHKHLFRAVFERVSGTRQSFSLLHILQGLVLIERNTPRGDKMWSVLERSLLAMTSPTLPLPPPPCGSGPAPPPPPPPPPALFGLGKNPAPAEAAVHSVFDKARNYQPRKRMKKVNWEKVSQCDAREGSALWHEASKPEAMMKVNVREAHLEVLFCQKGKAVTLKQTSNEVHLPNSKKAFKVDIVLDGLKDCCSSNDDVITAIRNGDTSVFNSIQATTLYKQMPDEKDIGFLQQFEADSSRLGRPEAFLLKLMQLQAYPTRLDLLNAQLQFKEILQDYLPPVGPFDLLETAIQELMHSRALRELLYIILFIGNVINGGTRMGGAHGFKVTSLQQLSTTLANVSQPNVNLFHYLATVCCEDCPSLLQFASELPHLRDASRISVETIQEDVVKWKQKMDEFREQLKLGDLPDDLQKQIQGFLSSADKEIDALHIRLEAVKQKGQAMAKYFCDNRPKFLDVVFLEMKKFMDEFNRVIQETQRERPIPLTIALPLSTQEDATTDHVAQKPYPLKRAVSIITEQELDLPGLEATSEEELLPLGISYSKTVVEAVEINEAQKEKPIPQTTTPILSSPVEVEQDNVIVSTPVEQDNAESLGVAVSQGTTDQEQDVTFLNSTSESQENSTHLLQQDIPRPTPVIPQTVPELQQSSHKKPVQKPRHEPSLMQHGQNESLKEKAVPVNTVLPVGSQTKQDNTTTVAKYAVKEKATSAVANKDPSHEVTVEGKPPLQDAPLATQAVRQENTVATDRTSTQTAPKRAQAPSLTSNPAKKQLLRESQNKPLSKRGHKVPKTRLSKKGVGGLRPHKTPSVDAYIRVTQNEQLIPLTTDPPSTERVKKDDGTAKSDSTGKKGALPLVIDQESDFTNLKVTSQENMLLPPQDASATAPAAQEEDAVITDWELPHTMLEPQPSPSFSSQKLELPFQYQPYTELQVKKAPTSHLSLNPKRKDNGRRNPQRKSSTVVHIKSKGTPKNQLIPTTTAPPVSTPTTTAPPVSTPMTTAPPVSTPMTTAPPVSTPMTTAPPVSTSMTTAPLVSTPMTTVPPVSTPMTVAPLVSTPMTVAPLVSTPMTTVPLVSTPMTTAPPVGTPMTTVPPVSTPTTAAPPVGPPTTAAPLVGTPVKQGNAKTGNNHAVKDVAESDQEQNITIHDANPQENSMNLLLQDAPRTTPTAQEEDAIISDLQSPQLCMNFNIQEILKDLSTLVSPPTPHDLPHISPTAQDNDAVTDQECSQSVLEHQEALPTKQAPSPTVHTTKHLDTPLQEPQQQPSVKQFGQKATTSSLSRRGGVKECQPDYIPSVKTDINETQEEKPTSIPVEEDNDLVTRNSNPVQKRAVSVDVVADHQLVSSREVASEESEPLPSQHTPHTTPGAQEEDAAITGQESPQTVPELQQTHLSSQPAQQLELPFQYRPYSQMQVQKVNVSPKSTRKGVQLSPTRKGIKGVQLSPTRRGIKGVQLSPTRRGIKGVRLSPKSLRKSVKRSHSDGTTKRCIQSSPKSVKRSHSHGTDSIRVQVKVKDTQKQTPLLLTLASAATIEDTTSNASNPVTRRPVSDISELERGATHKAISHTVTSSDKNNTHILPQDDSHFTPAVRERNKVVEDLKNLHSTHSSLQDILKDFASLVVAPLPHGQDPSLGTPAQDAVQEIQSLPEFQSPIFYSTAQEAPYFNQRAWRMPVGVSRPQHPEATSAGTQTLFSASLPGVVRILHKMADNILQDFRDHFRNRV